ncbi:unnamed protein product [Urochloa humidicola]
MSSTASPATLSHLLALLAAAVAVAAAADHHGMTHLHLYIHQNTSTAASFAGSPPPPLGAIDDELREGPEPASQYIGRAQGFLVQAGLGSPAAACTALSLAFAEGDYGGSSLVVYGRVGEAAAAERAVVGGTGRFRGARGYSLTTKLGNPTTGAGTAVVFEMDLYFKIGG